VRLGNRSTRVRAGAGRQLTGRQPTGRQPTGRAVRLAAGLGAGVVFVAVVLVAGAEGQRAAPAMVGPDRIVCNASFCEMGSGARPKERVRVIVSNLPQNEIRRLRKCTGVARPCIVIIKGTEQGDPMKIMASTIDWQD